MGIQELHAYANRRLNVDWNTCGQAAIGTILDFHHIDPFGLPRDRLGHWNDGAIIDALVADGQGPDVLFGWGTTPLRLGFALVKYGLPALPANVPFNLWNVQFQRLAENLASDLPVPVLL